ncbi:MAG: hypothetical protein IPN76_16240 [Saprospiraceae bacterium]|nr:hypothetical protein [Saprospiraceae bacterium]
MNESEISNFVRMKDGVCSSFITIKQAFYSIDGNKISNQDFVDLIKKVYQSAKTELRLKWRKQVKGRFHDEPDLNNEADLLSLFLPEDGKYYALSLCLDASFYWFDSNNESIGQILLPGGCIIDCIKWVYDGTSANVSINLYYEFNLFSNHICSVGTWGTTTPELTYFEPAAILNRKMMRDFAKKTSEETGMITEFSTQKNRVIPYDMYGYLDNADYKL